jgi:hypothetical protein
MLHSGDLFYDENVLNRSNKVIENSEIITSNCFYYKNDKKKIFRKWVKPFKKLSKLNSHKIAHTTMIIKKNIFFEIGYYLEKFKISSDTEFILRLISMEKKITYHNLNFVLMKYGGKSTSLKFFKKKLKEDLQIYYQYFGFKFIFFYFLKIFSKLFDFVIFRKFIK